MEQNSLRLILLVVGIAILIGIYLYDVLQRKRAQEMEQFDLPDNDERISPVMSDGPSFSAVFDEQQAVEPVKEVERVMDDEQDVPADTKPEEIPVVEQAPVVQLAILPEVGNKLSGSALLDAFTGLNLEFGDMGIFHCYERHDGVEIQRFHVANILEPGTFPVGSMSDFESTGIVLFFQANDSGDPELAFESMLNVAEQLSRSLEAKLLDAEMNELTIDKITDIQSQLAGLSH